MTFPSRPFLRGSSAWVLVLFFCVTAGAQQSASVLMISDLHFDPFHDPAKGASLVEAPLSQWDKILQEPDSGDQAANFAAVQKTCGARGADTDFALLESSLRAEQKQAHAVAFVTVTGDLLAHSLDCRYRFAMKGKDPDGYGAFAERLANYVIGRVETAFPQVPVYVALGNNDSSCGDYKMDPQDRFFKATSQSVVSGLRGVSASEAKRVREDYESGGYFGVTLPGLHRTRVLAVDDIFLSDKYTTCAGAKNVAGGSAMLAWLDRELAAAKAHGEVVWVIGHIPPGVDVYSTLRKGGNVCGDAPVRLFLGSDALAATLEKHADVIRLAVFAHTHSDELRLLRGDAGSIPMKLVASISPVNGNRPTFTVAQVDPKTATMTDYAVYEAPPPTEINAPWRPEYGFHETYHEPDFRAKSVGDLVVRLQADAGGGKPESTAYVHYFAPSMLPLLALVWPQYGCALDHTTADSYKACVCRDRK
jgi:sphingomyelin phosphodiesterase acid-like 3